MKRFAYVFSLCGKVVWSTETEKSLIERAVGEDSETYSKTFEFVKNSQLGQFYSLSTGEMVFRIE